MQAGEMSELSEVGNGKGKSSTGLDANVAALLAYVLGLVTGIVFLVLEKDNRFVKFHAIQSIAVTVVLIVLDMILGFVPIIGWIIILILKPLSFILWIVLLFQAYQGRWFKLPLIGQFCYEQAHK
jgi:uncharacterized membrane protein